MKPTLLPLLLASLAFIPPVRSRAEDLTLWYPKPASKWMTEALPIGNGRIGAMFFGGIAAERIQFNEDSLWTGDENPSGSYETMGAYQAFGDVTIHLTGDTNATDYRRELNLDTAIGSVSYRSGATAFRREYFASHPAEVIVLRFTADKPASYTGTIELTDAHRATVVAGDRGVTSTGTLKNGLHYEAQLRALNRGGTISAAGQKVEFKGCDELTVFLDAGTDYAMNETNGYRGELPHTRITRQLDAAIQAGADRLRQAHITDHQSLFRRVQLDLGTAGSDRQDLGTEERMRRYAADPADPALETLFFQYGRYLLIASSRNALPANLQGLWNDSNSPAWSSDYHSNINIQMNYWPAEPANLAECHEPLLNLIQSQLGPWRKATQGAPDFHLAGGSTRGWTVRTSHNIFGGMGWKWNNPANAWYAQHFFEHYAFSGDKAFLRNSAYPVLKEVCEFWDDHLKKLPDGRLVVAKGWSPEHGPEEDGVSYDQEIIWDLFTNYIEAADELGADPEYRARIASLREKLVQPAIGRWGQLQEWMKDRDDPTDTHRHVSHLFAVHPGRQISAARTPELAAAARKSLEARGDISTGWSMAWKINFWARLLDGNHAHRLLQNQLRLVGSTGFNYSNGGGTFPNLFDAHPPFQIDGNFGATAGICEMLLQSHTGEILLLPALPRAWPAGAARGLRARGGFSVDMRWQDGRLTAATIHATRDGIARVRIGGKVVPITVREGQDCVVPVE